MIAELKIADKNSEKKNLLQASLAHKLHKQKVGTLIPSEANLEKVLKE